MTGRSCGIVFFRFLETSEAMEADERIKSFDIIRPKRGPGNKPDANSAEGTVIAVTLSAIGSKYEPEIVSEFVTLDNQPSPISVKRE